MISRPIVIAPLIGLILNNLYAGLIIGAFVELIWIDRIPVGTYIPPNDSIVAVVATSVAALAGRRLGGEFAQLIALSILLAIPCGLLAQKADILIIKSNDSFSDRALEDAKKGNIRAIEKKVYLGLIKVFSFDVLYLFVIQSIFVTLVIWVYPKLPSSIILTLSFMYYFLPLVGIAAAMNTIKLRRVVSVFCAIFLIAAVFLELFHVL